jgi:hypothetical protein
VLKAVNGGLVEVTLILFRLLEMQVSAQSRFMAPLNCWEKISRQLFKKKKKKKEKQSWVTQPE